jgi:transcriptional regulator GlxA family with amidase domain
MSDVRAIGRMRAFATSIDLDAIFGQSHTGRYRGIRASRVQVMAGKPTKVSIVTFAESDPSIVYGIFDTLWAAGRLWNVLHDLPPGEPVFEPQLVSATTTPLHLVTGVTILPQTSIDDVVSTDIVFVPNVMVTSPHALEALDIRLIEWIARMHAQGAQLYASCGGSLVLAQAGLLAGLEATTHWAYAPLFRRLFPDVTHRADRVLVQSGPGQRIVCSGGASSWQDLVLLLIARQAGNDEAIRISKMFLYQWHAEGQLPYAAMMRNANHGDAAIGTLQAWLADNYARQGVIAEVVLRSGLPKRTFDRRFKKATGYAPLAYVHALRVEEAKQILETGDVTVEAIACEVGYDDIAYFRRLFRRLSGMTPAAYRRKFQIPPLITAREAGRSPRHRSGRANAARPLP